MDMCNSKDKKVTPVTFMLYASGKIFMLIVLKNNHVVLGYIIFVRGHKFDSRSKRACNLFFLTLMYWGMLAIININWLLVLNFLLNKIFLESILQHSYQNLITLTTPFFISNSTCQKKQYKYLQIRIDFELILPVLRRYPIESKS